MTRIWKEHLEVALIKTFGTKKGAALHAKYVNAFPTSYQEDTHLSLAIEDITQLEQLSTARPLEITFYQRKENNQPSLHLRLFQYGTSIPLSDVLPILENLDLRTFNEHPYEIRVEKNSDCWISDFSVGYATDIHDKLKKIIPLFQDAFTRTVFHLCENDGFNKLVLGAELTWREIMILRAYAKYLHQIRFRFSQSYIENTVTKHSNIAKDLITLFKLKFDPKQAITAKNALQKIEIKIQTALDAITSLDEDRIMRYFWKLICASLRTNYFQTLPNGQSKTYLSIKFQSNDIPDLPLPHPLYEIFVYSPRFEAIHLRAEKVARGGIRWSDRREDFRTEVLNLMKAQKVKNAIIVPSGAKGGFVLKTFPLPIDRKALEEEVIICYKEFISGLLDLTDNLKNNKVIRPKQVVCYDEPDTYLVVAADKGTATFSDIANSLSKKYDFWLGDAFASGGSTGYDHKKIGITARGAWESIRRHFHELNININKTDFTVVGIGDMSGDVFGNGMIYSRRINLIGAFDHRNIFIDPNPHPETSYRERVRLFKSPHLSWEDYNSKLISRGGGVFKRSSKSISISPEIKKCLEIEDNALTPNELIRALLKAPVDLLFNGGIGTYVKSSAENNSDIGDKGNEFCRINGNELRCRIVGEGGNLGFTQLGRVEYALGGGLINTDFIDNSGGVDCSDHEVNIKILLDNAIRQGKLTEEKRNHLLSKMTKEVAVLVLQDNYNQALTMSFSAARATSYTGLYQDYIKDLSTNHIIDRRVEFLPDDKTILERKAAGKGLTRPEIAVLLAYTKIHVKNEILKSKLPEDPYFAYVVETACPKELVHTFRFAMQHHPLRREIIATQLSNQIVNEMGVTFIYRLQTETGATVAEIIRAHTISASIFDAISLEKTIDTLDFKIPVSLQYELLHHVRHLLNLSTRWFLRRQSSQKNIAETIDHFSVRIKQLEKMVPSLMVGQTKIYLDSLIEQFVKAGIEKEIAQHIATYRALYTALNVIEVATEHRFDLFKTAYIYFDVGNVFNLVWFRDQLVNDAREGHWNTLARLTIRDELDTLQKQLTVVMIQKNEKESNASKIIHRWVEHHPRIIKRWEDVLQLLLASTNIDYAMFFIVLRELSDWIQISEPETA